MKFKIRFADQIVGFFVILSLVILVFVIIMLGRSQRWFAKDVSFFTVLPSAAGLGKNMAVQYKGFTIGNVSSFHLTENDDVEVFFVIHEDYTSRAKKGSLVEVMVSPVGLGNQFLFHAGNGEPLEDGALIPAVGTVQARELIRQGLAAEPRHDDSISILMTRVNSVLEKVDGILAQVNEALGPGSDVTEIGKIVGSIQKTLEGVEGIPKTADAAVNSAVKMIEGVLVELRPAIANITALTAELNEPDGLVYTVLDTDKDVYVNLVKSLESVSRILESLDKTTAFVPTQIPQISGIIMELRTTLKTVEDVLVALSNNPLFRKGIPRRPEAEGGAGPRNLRF